MWSDFRIADRPLSKLECDQCRAVQSLYCNQSENAFFDANYMLYSHAPGRNEEIARQTKYADWLSPLITGQHTLFEAGAGNGSFLLAVKNLIPEISVSGVEPAPRASTFARSVGLAVETDFLGLCHEPHVDVALAINVIEHVSDPQEFLHNLKSHSKNLVIVVCPDGSIPNSELLIADHLHSFDPTHIRMLFTKVGLRTCAQVRAPADLGAFFVTVGVRAGIGQRTNETRSTRWSHLDKRAQPISRNAYLTSWSNLDEILLTRIGRETNVGCFGAGEAAAMLRAYAPQSWSRVSACFIDNPLHGEVFGDLPVLGTISAPATLLLGVRPEAQPGVAGRLIHSGHSAIRWDDILSGLYDRWSVQETD